MSVSALTSFFYSGALTLVYFARVAINDYNPSTTQINMREIYEKKGKSFLSHNMESISHNQKWLYHIRYVSHMFMKKC